MNRTELEQIIRAASTAAEDTDIVVVGELSVLGQYPDAPSKLLFSKCVELYPKNQSDGADAIEEALGEDSSFHESHGFYARSVDESQLTLPEGWKERLVAIELDDVTGWCLELHDLAVAKYVSGEPKDRRYLETAIRHELLDEGTLNERLEVTDIDSLTRDQLSAMMRADFV